jgi:hypothetical protein
MKKVLKEKREECGTRSPSSKRLRRPWTSGGKVIPKPDENCSEDF